ncbi:testis-expressed protein 10 homolog [Prorops nasuta]|uniref:testis-expressed protein 10 homolog n=1 Tax=Prorops nasuta TaxID=863751 RepID=UPI0034D02159
MGKNNRHKKNLKSEKAKVKLKAKKATRLPKGLNVTDTSFKVKKIIIKEQLKHQDDTEILSRRKLNVKDLLSRLQHHNSTVRQEAVKELKEILSQHSPEILSSQFSSLLQGVSALSLDKEKNIRRDSLKVLSLILSPTSKDQLYPFCDILISYLKCAMTHIDTNIKEDSLLFLDVLAQNCNDVLAQNSLGILPCFLDMISKLHTEIKPGRQLTTTLNSKNTSVKWRNKVLERLNTIFKSILIYNRPEENLSALKNVINANENSIQYLPIYQCNYFDICKIDFTKNIYSMDLNSKEIFSNEELYKYINLLMPLMFDSWIEVLPTDKHRNSIGTIINSEAAVLLTNIIEIIQSILKYMELVSLDSDYNIMQWFKDTFQPAFVKNFFLKFPYSKQTVHERNVKRQEDFNTTENTEKCLYDNLAVCHIYIWLVIVNSNHFIHDTEKQQCIEIVNYLIDRVENWTSTQMKDIVQLSHVINILFLRASKILYKNNINLGSLLRALTRAIKKQQKLQKPSQLIATSIFSLLSNIIKNNTLIELHNEEAFKEYILTLPDLLLQPKIHDTTIEIINTVVLRYREWIQDRLIEKQENIIKNSKEVNIIGSSDDKQSRLTICNLFYFLNGQLYF